MKPYDQQNALVQLAKQCNAECTKATTGHKPKEFTALTLPIFNRYAGRAASIGCSLNQLKYQVAKLNRVIGER